MNSSKLFKFFQFTRRGFSTKTTLNVTDKAEPLRTSLYALHIEMGAKMVPFGGYEMPVVYADANISESHLHTRQAASLFDVSHMLQTEVTGAHRVEYLESVCTSSIHEMKVGHSTLSLFTDRHTGGILDDLVITKTQDCLHVVSNASMRHQDINIMTTAENYFKSYGKDVNVRFCSHEERSLLALQGPASQSVLQPLVPHLDLSTLYFMQSITTELASGHEVHVGRCGYTGEDGFEISIPSEIAIELARNILKAPQVKMAGLGARDTLRLEAGLCLYGNDIDKTTSPAAAGLMWAVGKRRRDLQDYPGARLVQNEITTGPTRKRVGLLTEGSTGGPVPRHGTPLLADGEPVGVVTSGSPAPSLGSKASVAMGYVKTSLATVGTQLVAKVRSIEVPVRVVKMPFVPNQYYRNSK